MRLSLSLIFFLFIASGFFYWRHLHWRNNHSTPTVDTYDNSENTASEDRVQSFLKLSDTEKRKKLDALNDLKPALKNRIPAPTRPQPDDEKQAELLRQSENLSTDEVNYEDLSDADKKIVAEQYQQDMKQIETMRKQQSEQKTESK